MKHRLTIGDVRGILDQTGLDLLQIDKPEVLGRVQADYVWIGRVASILGGGSELSGEALAAARDRLWSMIVAFYPAADGTETGARPEDFDPWREVYLAAGAVGVDPSPLTLRELYWMAEGAWKPFTMIASPIICSNVEKKSDRKTPDELNPYARPQKPKLRRYNGTRRLLGV